MRKVYLLCLFCGLLIPSLLKAQSGLKLGAIVMPMYVTLLNADDSALPEDEFLRESLGGMSGGLMLGLNIGENFGIRINALYSQEGARYSVRKDHINRINHTIRLEYIKLPFMIGLHSNATSAAGGVNKLRFSFYTGIQLGLLTRADYYNDDTDFEPPIPDNVTGYPDPYGQYAKTNYSVVGEFGIDLWLVDDLELNLHLRGNYGLTDSENKDATFRVTEGGQTSYQEFWAENRAETRSFNVGLMIGLTWTVGGNSY